MSGILQYRPLFTVEIAHDYYLSEDLELYGGDSALRNEMLVVQNRDYQFSRDLTIAPTADCAQIMRGYRLLFRPTSQGFFVGARVTPVAGSAGAFTPVVRLDTPIRLRFALSVDNPHFFNMTNLRMDKEAARRETFLYYFSNRADNIVDNSGQGDRLYLSQPLGAYDADAGYEAGELVLQGGMLQEAIEDIQPGTSFNTNSWRQIYNDQNPHFQFVSAADRLPLRPAVFNHTVSNASENHAALRILLYDRDGSLLDNLRFDAQDPSTTNPTLTECSIDLRNYSPGVYRLEVLRIDGTVIPAFELVFYLDDILYRQKPFALIECFHEPDGSLGNYRWLDQNNSDQLLQPTYRIRWKNRPTWWRYYYTESPAFTAASSDVENLDADSTAPNHRILITDTPQALTQITRRIELTQNGEEHLLPNPSPERIFPEGGRLYSEINMGGGLGPPQ